MSNEPTSFVGVKENFNREDKKEGSFLRRKNPEIVLREDSDAEGRNILKPSIRRLGLL